MKTLTGLCLVYVGERAHRFPEHHLADLPASILSQIRPYLSAAQLHRLDDVFKRAGISTVATWRRHLHQRWPHTHHRYPAVFGETAPTEPHRHYMEKHFHELLRHAHFGQHTDPSCVLDMCLHHMILMRFPIRDPSSSIVDQPLRDQLISFAPYVQRLSITALQCCHLVQSAELMALLQRSVATLDLHLGQDRYYHNMRTFLLLLLMHGRLEHIALYNTRLIQRHIKDLLRVCAGHFGFQGMHPPQVSLQDDQHQVDSLNIIRSPSANFCVQPSTSISHNNDVPGMSSRGSSLISPARLTALHLKTDSDVSPSTSSGKDVHHRGSHTTNHWLSPSDDDNTSGPDEDDEDSAEAELDLYDAALLLPSSSRPHGFLHRHVRLRNASRHGFRYRSNQTNEGDHDKAADFYAHPQPDSSGDEMSCEHKKAAAFYAHPQSESSSSDSSPPKGNSGHYFVNQSQFKTSTKRSLSTTSPTVEDGEPSPKAAKSDTSHRQSREEDAQGSAAGESSQSQQTEASSSFDRSHTECTSLNYAEPGSSIDNNPDVKLGKLNTDQNHVCSDLNKTTVRYSKDARIQSPQSSVDSLSPPKKPMMDNMFSNNSSSSESNSASTSGFVIKKHQPTSTAAVLQADSGPQQPCCRTDDDTDRTPLFFNTSTVPQIHVDRSDIPLFGVKSMAVIECIESMGGNLGTYLAAVLPSWTGLQNLTLTSTRTKSTRLSEELLERLQGGQLRSLVLEDTPLCDSVLTFLTRALTSHRAVPLKVMKLSNNMQELSVSEQYAVPVTGPFIGTETLDLSYNTFVQSGIVHISKLLQYDSALRHLCLEACHFSENEISILLTAIQANGALETLSLAENLLSISSQYDVIRTMNALPQLKSLNLNTCLIDAQIAVSDEFLTAVLQHPNLERLTLATNRLGGAGCQLLQRVLEGCHSNDASSGRSASPLRWLDLGYNCIPGARLLATGQQMQADWPTPRRPFLSGLVLSGNLVSPHQRAQILRAFNPLAAQVVADTLDFSVPLAEYISQM